MLLMLVDSQALKSNLIDFYHIKIYYHHCMLDKSIGIQTSELLQLRGD